MVFYTRHYGQTSNRAYILGFDVESGAGRRRNVVRDHSVALVAGHGGCAALRRAAAAAAAAWLR